MRAARAIPLSEPASFGRAVITSIVSTDTVVAAGDRGPRRAAVAVLGYAPRVGDAVVLATDGGGAYVIGVLDAAPVALSVEGPGEVAVAPAPGCEVLRVRDADGRLVFEHREGRSILHAPAGDLALSAPAGAIELSAACGVRVRTTDIELDASSIGVRADRAELEANDVHVVARALSSAVETLEVHAEQIIERAVNVYRDVEELAQTRAGRIRLVAETTFHLFARRTHLKAEEDLKLKGEKIHLG